MSAKPDETKRRRVIYAGRVQGVGFRYTSRMLAEPFPIVGFVKNLPDGTVELQAEGAPEAVREFLAKVEEHFRSQIREATGADLPPRGDEPAFTIAY